MKKAIPVLFLSVSFLVVFPAVLRAVDVSLGASLWYTDWVFAPDKTSTTGGPQKSTMGPELMYGPALSLRFSQDWSLACVLLRSTTFSMPNGSSDGSSMGIIRWDSDNTLNYNINKYIKIFPGIKLMRFTFPGGYHESAGPGVGAGLTLPIVDNLFFLLNGTGAYLFGRHKDTGNSETGMREYGFNANASLAYYIEAISTTISLGYRYQYFYTDYDKSGNINLSHTFRGFNMSAIYSF